LAGGYSSRLLPNSSAKASAQRTILVAESRGDAAARAVVGTC